MSKEMSILDGISVTLQSTFMKKVKEMPKPPKGCHYEPTFRFTRNNSKWDITMSIITKEDLV